MVVAVLVAQLRRVWTKGASMDSNLEAERDGVPGGMMRCGQGSSASVAAGGRAGGRWAGGGRGAGGRRPPRHPG